MDLFSHILVHKRAKQDTSNAVWNCVLYVKGNKNNSALNAEVRLEGSVCHNGQVAKCVLTIR